MPVSGCTLQAARCQLRPRRQIKRTTVHAPALAACLERSVVEDVAKMRMAFRAANFRAHHPMRTVFENLDRARQGPCETGPAGTRVVLRLAVEQLIAARRAAVQTIIVGVDIFAGKCALSARFPQDVILVGGQFLTPLGVSGGHAGR